MDRNLSPAPGAALADGVPERLAALSRADALVDSLAAGLDVRPLEEHVDAFESVHQLLVDALAQTEG